MGTERKGTVPSVRLEGVWRELSKWPAKKGEEVHPMTIPRLWTYRVDRKCLTGKTAKYGKGADMRGACLDHKLVSGDEYQ